MLMVAQTDMDLDQDQEFQSMEVTEECGSAPMTSNLTCVSVEELHLKLVTLKAEVAHYYSMRNDLGEKRRYKNAFLKLSADQERFNELQAVTVQLISELESSLSVIAGDIGALRESAGEAYYRNEELKSRCDQMAEILAPKNEKIVHLEEQEADLVLCLSEVTNYGAKIEQELKLDRNGELVAMVEQLAAENKMIGVKMQKLSRLLDEKADESQQYAAKTAVNEEIIAEIVDLQKGDISAIESLEKRLLETENGEKEDMIKLKELKDEFRATKLAKRNIKAELKARQKSSEHEIRDAENRLFKLRGENDLAIQGADHESLYRLKQLQESIDLVKANSGNLVTEKEQLNAELEDIMNETTTLNMETDGQRERLMELRNAIKRKEADHRFQASFKAEIQQKAVIKKNEMAPPAPRQPKRQRAKKADDEHFEPPSKKKKVAIAKPMPLARRSGRCIRDLQVYDDFDTSADDPLVFSRFSRGLNR